MKLWTKLLIPVLVVAMVGVAEAKGKKGGKEPVIKGKIVSVASDGTNIVVKEGKKKTGTQVTVQTGKSTAVTIDGAAGKAVTDLKPGEKVKIKSKKGTAKSIKATTKKHGKGNKGHKKPKA